MLILHVVGARPNFMKAAPVMDALNEYDHIRQVLVHTGQHYDANMSSIFFEELGLPSPDINLEVGSDSHAVQTAEIMIRIEQVLLSERPDWVLVYGDVNSTVAAAIVSAKLLIPVAHVEAGLRSYDRTMPEEINRLLTDQIADILFTPSHDGNTNLANEGVPEEKIHLVGNVMIDTVIRLLPQAREKWLDLKSNFGIDDYGLITLHRPSNVDDPEMLQAILTTLNTLSQELTLIFPIHPRTRRNIVSNGFDKLSDKILLLDPTGYLEFLALQDRASLVITDSGGIQEETTFLGIPCLTVRENTERPITTEIGTNILVGRDMRILKREFHHIVNGGARQGEIPQLWDGHTGERIAQILAAR